MPAANVTVSAEFAPKPIEREAPTADADDTPQSVIGTTTHTDGNRTIWEPADEEAEAASKAYDLTSGYAANTVKAVIDFDVKIDNGDEIRFTPGKKGTNDNAARLDKETFALQFIGGADKVTVKTYKDSSTSTDVSDSLTDTMAPGKWYNVKMETIPKGTGFGAIKVTISKTDPDTCAVTTSIGSFTLSDRSLAGNNFSRLMFEGWKGTPSVDNMYIYAAKTYETKIKVVNNEGEAGIEGVDVTLAGEGLPTYKGTTTSTGEATMTKMVNSTETPTDVTGVIPGTYTATASKSGFLPAEGIEVIVPVDGEEPTIKLTAGEEIAYSITLKAGAETLDTINAGTSGITGYKDKPLEVPGLKKVIQKDSKYYVLDTSGNDNVEGYTVKVNSLTEANKEITVNYTEDNTIVFYAEGEDTTLVANGGNSSSDGKTLETNAPEYSGKGYGSTGKRGAIITGITEAGTYSVETYFVSGASTGIKFQKQGSSATQETTPLLNLTGTDKASANGTFTIDEALTDGVTVKGVGSWNTNNNCYTTTGALDYIIIRKTTA